MHDGVRGTVGLVFIRFYGPDIFYIILPFLLGISWNALVTISVYIDMVNMLIYCKTKITLNDQTGFS
jgi:hypothetical protein